MSTQDRIAVVTGAGSGIGQTCATALLNEGWTVVFVGRRADALDAAIAAAGDTKGKGIAMPCDVGDEAAVNALFDSVQQRFGRLDVLFNNAGMGLPPKTPDEVGGEAWRQVV